MIQRGLQQHLIYWLLLLLFSQITNNNYNGVSLAGAVNDGECDAARRSILVATKDPQKDDNPEEYQPVELSTFPTKEWTTPKGETRFLYVIDKDKSLFYVPDFLNSTDDDDDDKWLIQELISFCEDQERFVQSPQRRTTSTKDDLTENQRSLSQDKHRTSESCPMIPSGMYRKNPQFQDMVTNYEAGLPADDVTQREKIGVMIREVNVTWEITERAAALPFGLTTGHEEGTAKMTIDPYHIEPLQLVRYIGAGAAYHTHHDHGLFYGIHDSEQRPYTILVYLNNVQGGGGATHFPKLGLRFLPVKGDAIVWSNILLVAKHDDESGDDGTTTIADPDMVHAGEPPASEEGEKYALNIWVGQAALNTENAKYGQWS